MEKLTKRDLVIRVAEETGLPQWRVGQVVQKMLDNIIEAVYTEKKVEFRRFGIFDVRERKARIGRNPKNPNEEITIPSRKVVRFRAGKEFQEKVNSEA